jgi:hypothetical protein
MTYIKVKEGVPMEMDADDNPTFEVWLKRVDRFLEHAIGLKHDDLADCLFKDWYEERLRPIRAANRALAYNEGNDAEDGDEDYDEEEVG